MPSGAADGIVIALNCGEVLPETIEQRRLCGAVLDNDRGGEFDRLDQHRLKWTTVTVIEFSKEEIADWERVTEEYHWAHRIEEMSIAARKRGPYYCDDWIRCG